MKHRLVIVSFVALLAGAALWRAFSSRRQEEEASDPEPQRVVHVCIVYSSKYGINLGGLERLHPFDIHKYKRIYERLATDKIVDPLHVEAPDEISEADLLRVHTAQFLQSLRKPATVAACLEAPAMRLIPETLLEKGVLRPFRYATGGTLLAARRALQHGIAINLGGGYHHAKPDAGEGFCVYADMPVAIRVLQAEGAIKRALVIDLDVHQGNGTAVCLADDDATFCFSMHQGDIYPIPKEQSDLDVELEAGTGDAGYLELLEKHLPQAFEAAGKPDIVFYQAGCDTLAGDPLASIEMSEDGIVKRDRMVIDACVRRQAPVVMTLGGGYSKDAWRAQYSSIRAILQSYGQAVSDG